MDKVAWIDGWEVRPRPDGSYGVYDYHGLLAGPFGTVTDAIVAARQLPRPAGTMGALKPSAGDVLG